LLFFVYLCSFHMLPAVPLLFIQQRMPSGMQGYKRDVEEGGVRNYLAISGPGVQAGVIDSTLTDITDILPTIAALAGIQESAVPHKPWDGLSLQNLVLAGNDLPSSGRRGTSRATQQQLDRFVFSLGPLCWDANSVPKLAGDRR
jgi:arylsulfatase A-like enzyme